MDKESKLYQELEGKVQTLLEEHLKDLRLATQEVHNALPSDKADKITDPLFNTIIDSEELLLSSLTEELVKELQVTLSSKNLVTVADIEESEEYQSLADKYDELMEGLTHSLDECKELSDTIDTLEEGYDELEEQLDDLREDYEALRAEYDELERATGDLDNSYKTLRVEYDEVVEDLNTIAKEKEELESQVDDLEDEIEYLRDTR